MRYSGRIKQMAERLFERRLKRWLRRTFPALQTSTPEFTERPALEILGKLIRSHDATVVTLSALQEKVLELNTQLASQNRQLKEQRQELDEKNQELDEKNQRLETQVMTDQLTGLNNRIGLEHDFIKAVNLLSARWNAAVLRPLCRPR